MENLIKNGLEIERRFLVTQLPQLEHYQHKDIIQYYLNDNYTRLRRIDNDYILTQKSGSGISRTEIEYQISKDHFNNLKLGAKSYITKTRYFIPLENDLIAELDIFNGNFEGIIICEIEFSNMETANNFTKPKWLGTEITLEKKLTNKQMSKNPKKALLYFNEIFNKYKK